MFCLADVRLPISGSAWIAVPLPIPLDEVIRAALYNALAYADGNQEEAGKLLKIGERTMSHKMRVYGIPAVHARAQRSTMGHGWSEKSKSARKAPAPLDSTLQITILEAEPRPDR